MGEERAYFGGPGLPPGRLRDLLAEHVAAVPAGGAIDWVTYYLRDRRLAAELVRARERGVRVRVTLDGHPRTPHANAAVAAALSEGLGDGFRLVRSVLDGAPLGKFWRPRLHEKLYCFSHPSPVAFIGSFNPSGDDPEEEPEILEAIGDQDRGHNVLVALRGPALVEALVAHARRLHTGWHGPLSRFAPSANRTLRGDGFEVWFWPRVLPHPVIRRLSALPTGSRVRIAASHLSGPTSVRTLLDLARRRIDLAVIAESTLRRVPADVERRLTSVGIPFRRYTHPDGLPMHDKFVLIEAPADRWVAFGSFNWTEPSRRMSREIGAISNDPALFDAFSACWERLVGAA